MTRELDDCKATAAMGVAAISTAKNMLKIMADRVSKEECLTVNQAHALMIQAVKKAEDAMLLLSSYDKTVNK